MTAVHTALAGHQGLPPLDLTTVFTRWTPDVPTIVVVLLLGAAYLAGVRRARADGGAWPAARVIAVCAGLGLIAATGVTFIGAYADTLFWVRALQNITLLMVVPLCLALGSPVALLVETLPATGLARLNRALASRTARVLTYPASVSILLIATPWALYFTGWYPAVLTNPVVDHLTRLALLLVGFLYFYSRLQLDPVPHKFPHLVSVVITFVEVVFDAALGLVLWLSPHIVAEAFYQGVGRNWGPSLRTDQIVGAGVLWLVGDLAGLPFLGALMNRMSKDDAAEAAEIDRQLDEQDVRDALATTALATTGIAATAPDDAAPDAPADAEPARKKLWWEDDPVLSERFHRGRRG